MAVLHADPDTARAQAIAGELRVLVGRLRRRLREEVRAGDLSEPQIAVLAQLAHRGPATVTTLAKAQGMRSQSMGVTVASLVAEGMVCGSPDPTDGRQTVLSLTAAARKAIKAIRAAREDWLFRTIQTKFSAREQKALATGVELLRRLVDP